MAAPTDPFSDDFADDFDEAELDAVERAAAAAASNAVAGPSRQVPLFRGSDNSSPSSAVEHRTAPRRVLAAQTPESDRVQPPQVRPVSPNASPNKGSSPRSVLQFVDSSPAFEIISPPHGAAAAARQAASTSKAKSSTSYDDSFDEVDEWDESTMAGLDQIEANIQRGVPSAAAGPSSVRATLHQRTLFGDRVPNQPDKAPSWDKEGYTRAMLQAGSSAGGSSEAVNGRDGVGGLSTGAGTRACKTKQWDRTAYAKSGHRYRNAAGVKRKRGFGNEEEDEGLQDEDGEPVEDWDRQGQVYKPPEPARDIIPDLLPMKLKIDEEACKVLIYPTNKEMRDYQRNIVQKAMFNNVLVALPTGLGKTFIAAVVILNYYHWFPEGKIIFVAPTRPLVSQQQVACHGICGLPWETAVEMTGSTRAALRGDEWTSKRIFYMTPQCFENDLMSSAVDARDVCCVVVDEAHRATGNYSYGNVIRYLTQRNPYFRVLALSATPGNNSEKVQEVVDNLHISHIEIRTEEAIDIRQYVHKKHEHPILVGMDTELKEVVDLWGKMMKVYLEPLNKANLIFQTDPTAVHPFAVRQVMRDPRHKSYLNNNKHCFPKLSQLATMAAAMQYLIEHSVRMFESRLREIEEAGKGKGKGKGKGGNFTDANADFRKVKSLVAAMTAKDARYLHPKMQHLRDAVTKHLAKETEAGNAETKVMVFCSWRECVTEIVECLNRVPNIKAQQFIGQAADRQGNKGFKQSDQEQVIQQFKKGYYNVLVATSIGEEGLDIGEIDLIVCYEAVKDSVRMLQRVGRTGRKRDGQIVVLMAEGREEKLWKASKENYKAVQHDITGGLHVTLFDDVPRLVPQSIKPQTLLKNVEQPEFNPEKISGAAGSGGRRATKAKKPKRNSDMFRDIPEDTMMGFIQASAVKTGATKAKGKGKAKAKPRKKKRTGASSGESDEEEEDEDDDKPAAEARPGISDDSDDEILAAGLNFDKLNKAQGAAGKSAAKASSSVVAAIQRPKGRSLGMRRPLSAFQSPSSSTMQQLGANISAPSSSRRVVTMPQLLVARPDSEADSEIEILSRPPSPRPDRKLASSPEPASSPKRASSPALDYTRRRPHALIAELAAQLSSDDTGDVEPRIASEPEDDFEAAFDDDDILELDLDNPAPLAPTSDALPTTSSTRQSNVRPQARFAEPSSSPLPVAGRVSHARPSADTPAGKHRAQEMPTPGGTNISDESPFMPRVRRFQRPLLPTSSPGGAESMAPPARPSKRFRRAAEVEESPVNGESSKAGARRSEAADKSAKAGKSVSTTKRIKKKRIGDSPTSRVLFRRSAERDTDDEMHGDPDEDDEGLTESADSDDLEHVGSFEATQARRGYHQQSIYARSLLTQALPTQFQPVPRERFVGGKYGEPDTQAPVDGAPAPAAKANDAGDDYERDSWCASDASDVGALETGSSQLSG